VEPRLAHHWLGSERVGCLGYGVSGSTGYAGERWMGRNLARDLGPRVADDQGMGMVFGTGNAINRGVRLMPTALHGDSVAGRPNPEPVLWLAGWEWN